MGFTEAAALIGLVAALLLGLGWRRAGIARPAEPAASAAAAGPTLAERRAAYASFRRSVHALLDGVDEGVYPMGLLYEVRDLWVELRRVAPPAVAGPAGEVVEALKPVIDQGPTNETFTRLTRALHAFDEASRADRAPSIPPVAPAQREVPRPVLAAPTRRYFTVENPPVSDVLEQSDAEAALTREFVGRNLQAAPLPPRELSPRR